MFGKRIVILSPHLDDEVLGCGGLLARARDYGLPTTVTIVYFADRHPDFVPEVIQRERDQLLAVAGCDAREHVIADVNHYAENAPITDFISCIEEVLNDLRPDTVLVPFPSYNQDHRCIYDAAMTAVRPHDQNFLVRNVLIYEQPETVQTVGIVDRFAPNVFYEIDIDKKLIFMAQSL